MKFQKKLIYLLVFSITLSLAVSGCRTKTPPVEKKSFAGIELTYYKFLEDTDVMQPFIDSYIAKHPGLKINYRKFSDFSEYQRVILNEMAEGEGPDIFSMPNHWFVSNYRKLSPMPLDVGTPEAFEATFVDVATRDLVRPDSDGVRKIYGLPMTVDTLALYYNKSHFEDALPETGRPSATWEGIKEDVAALNKEDSSFDRFERSGIALGGVENISYSIDIVFLMMLQHGVQFYDTQVTKAIFAINQNAFNALKLYAGFSNPDLKYYSWSKLDSTLDGKEIEAFARGEVSMIVGYSSARDSILNYVNLLKSRGESYISKDDVRVAQIPQLYDPQVSADKRVTYANYFAESVSRNSENADVAWDFLLELTSKENLDNYFTRTHRPTSRRDMISDQKSDANYGIFASQVGFAESFPLLEYSLFRDLFLNLVSNFSENGATQNGLAHAQDEVNKLIPKGGYVPLLKPKDEKS